MRNLVSIADLGPDEVEAIWSLADAPGPPLEGTVAWSFEGNGIRTRTTFIQAFRELGLQFTELPNLLKTDERVEDLAGYLDPFYSLYVIREANHERLQAFARASARPVINAMSSHGHPCEVLSDAYFIDRALRPLREARICLWGPTTNVFRSWHELASVLGLDVVQVCETRFHAALGPVAYAERPAGKADVVITDGWPSGLEAAPLSLTEGDLVHMGNPALLPTPPFTVGRELAFDPARYARFVGYGQKQTLLTVQKAVLRYAAAP